MFRIHPTFFDVLAILLCVFMLITVLMAKNVQQEYLTKVDMLKKGLEKNSANGTDTDAISLTVIPKGNGIYDFILASKKLGERKLEDLKQVKDELTRYRPTTLNLRIDKSVPTGVTQELLYDAQELGIFPYLAMEKG
jgi:biopolymer transport protein ExbD